MQTEEDDVEKDQGPDLKLKKMTEIGVVIAVTLGDEMPWCHG